MSAISREYLNLSPTLKTGIGGAIAAAACIAAGITSPVTLIAVAAIGQAVAWGPDMFKRYIQRAPVPPAPVAAPLAARVPQLAQEAERARLEMQELQIALIASRADQQTAIQNDQNLAEAMQASWNSANRRDPDLDLGLALGLSLENQQDEKAFVPPPRDNGRTSSFTAAAWIPPVSRSQGPIKTCCIASAITLEESSSPIPGEFLVTKNSQNYHRGHLILSLLSVPAQKDAQENPMYRDPLSSTWGPADLQNLEEQIGLHEGALSMIWVQSELPDAPQDADPVKQAERRTQYRMFLLKEALTTKLRENTVINQHTNTLRQQYLDFFNSSRNLYQGQWKKIPPNKDAI